MATAQRRNERRGRAPKTLTMLWKSLQGHEIIVDLKNENQLHGHLDFADDAMNLTMVDVVSENMMTGEKSRLDIVFIAGTKIQYIHVPDSINMVKNLEKYVSMVESRRKSGRSKRKAPAKGPPVQPS